MLFEDPDDQVFGLTISDELLIPDSTEVSLFDNGDGDKSYSTTAGSIFDLESQETGQVSNANEIFTEIENPSSSIEDLNPILIADRNQRDSCKDNQLLRRIRGRASDVCRDTSPVIGSGADKISSAPEGLTTDEELATFFFPTKYFQGILNIPVCVFIEDALGSPSDIFSMVVPRPILELELKNLRC